MSESTFREKLCVKIESRFVKRMVDLAKNYGVNILVSGFVEKTGNRTFVSSILASTRGSLFTYRKVVLDRCEEKLGIKRGGSLDPFKLDFASISVSIGQEILYPELIKFKCVSSDMLIHYSGDGLHVDRDLQLLKDYSTIYSTPVVFVGGVFEADGGLTTIPVFILDNGGKVIYEYRGSEEAVIVASISKMVGKVKKPELHNENIKHVYKLLRKSLCAGGRGSKFG